jgi:SAM-dependent MidA family methyltransferase
MSDLPIPSPQELETSTELARLVRQEIEQAGGAIPFSRYMELCLYAPGLGYYSAGRQKFGPGGDFVTAPELSSLFGRCLARSCATVLKTPGGGDLLEFGAGSGKLAVDLLGELSAMNCLPGRYYILERSAELKQRQQETLQKHLPHLLDKVVWLDRLPDAGFRGVMLANEVLDAMSVERFRWTGSSVECFDVIVAGNGFEWRARAASAGREQSEIQALAAECDMAAGFVSEVNFSLRPWLQAVADVLESGLLLLVDYGYPRHEYYHAQRSAGTLMCHYQHRAHDDPLLWPGLQDITAHVDFTAVAEAAVAADLAVAGYTTQAWFLLDCGLDEFLQQAGPTDSVEYMQQAQRAKTLILPGEMGERFKCIGLTRELEQDIPGFRMQDMRARL